MIVMIVMIVLIVLIGLIVLLHGTPDPVRCRARAPNAGTFSLEGAGGITPTPWTAGKKPPNYTVTDWKASRPVDARSSTTVKSQPTRP